MKLSNRGKIAALTATAMVAGVAGTVYWTSRSSHSRPVPVAAATPGAAVSAGRDAAETPALPAGPTTPEHPQGTSTADGEDPVTLRPLPVATRTGRHAWTQGDGKDVQVIQRIAHNPAEVIKMVEENDRIHRRQLVYRDETFDALALRARAKGEQVSRFTLPGMDGLEIEVEIDRADLSPSGQSGSITGHVAGKPNSMVTLAYQFGREAFTVLSQDDGLYLQADPRESGEVIVKSIDPATYAPGRCGTDDHVAGQ